MLPLFHPVPQPFFVYLLIDHFSFILIRGPPLLGRMSSGYLCLDERAKGFFDEVTKYPSQGFFGIMRTSVVLVMDVSSISRPFKSQIE